MKLDYIKELGVDSIWLSPIYQGGGIDYGYDGNDVTNHSRIDPLFGSDQDFEDLLEAVAERGKIKFQDTLGNGCKIIQDSKSRFSG